MWNQWLEGHMCKCWQGFQCRGFINLFAASHCTHRVALLWLSCAIMDLVCVALLYLSQVSWSLSCVCVCLVRVGYSKI